MTAATHTLHAPAIRLKRVYEEADEHDGVRVLVDRLWPRGVSKDAAHLDAWMKNLGPSDELRTWFGRRTDRWNTFRERYQKELRIPLRQLLLGELESVARGSTTLSLVYGAHDTRENEAVVIREYLLGKHPKSDASWEDARGLLATLGAVTAAQSGAQVPMSALRVFVPPHLTDRHLDAALQALESDGLVRKSATGWNLTSSAIKQVRQLSDSA
jgi:uncharacterized protein YeaO (DUF488 family)